MSNMSDWQQRLCNAKKAAEEANEGDVAFLEVSRVPLVSLFITTGKMKDRLNKKRSVDLRYVTQHSSYPKNIESMSESDNKGYQEFKRVVESRKISKFYNMTFGEYKVMFQRTCIHIDQSIRQYHGVQCHIDGDTKNLSIDNCYFLHICDIFNLFPYNVLCVLLIINCALFTVNC